MVESVGKLGHCLWLVEARCSVSQKLVGCWDQLAVLARSNYISKLEKICDKICDICVQAKRQAKATSFSEDGVGAMVAPR